MVEPTRWKQMTFPHSYGINYVLHAGMSKRKIMKQYSQKMQQDQVIFIKFIKNCESEFQIQIPEVIIAECKEYFMMFDQQKIDDIEYDGITKRLVDEIECKNINVQKVVLETLGNICEFGTEYMVHDVISYRMCSKLKESQCVVHKDANIRQSTHRIISAVLRSSHGLQSIMYSGMIGTLMDVLTSVNSDIDENILSQNYLFDIFTNAINYSNEFERKILMKHGIDKVILMYFYSHQVQKI